MYIHVYQTIKHREPGPCNSLLHADKRKYFSCLTLMRNRREAHTCFTWRGKWEKFGNVLVEKKVTLSWLVSSGLVKPEIFYHHHLACHFTVPWTGPLSTFSRRRSIQIKLFKNKHTPETSVNIKSSRLPFVHILVGVLVAKLRLALNWLWCMVMMMLVWNSYLEPCS